MKKLDYEERIAVSLLIDEPRERIGLLRLATERVRDKASQFFRRQRTELDVLNPSGCPDRLQLAHERMRCSDLVGAEGANEKEMTEVGPTQQVFQQVERRRVEPLQVIEEQRQRMFRPGEDANELPEHHLEAALCVLWRKLGDRRRLSEDELNFRNEIHDQSCVGLQRLPQRVTPRRKVRFTFAEQGSDQALKCLCQCRAGNIALVLVELAGREKGARRYQ